MSELTRSEKIEKLKKIFPDMPVKIAYSIGIYEDKKLHISMYEIKTKTKIENIKLSSVQMMSWDIGKMAVIDVHEVKTHEEIIDIRDEYREKWGVE